MGIWLFSRSQRLVSATAITLAVAPVVASCGAENSGAGEGSGDTTVALVQQPWEDLVVENQIVDQLLGELGYDVEINDVGVPVGAQSLSDGDSSVYLGNWWPSQQPPFQDFLDDGSIQVVGTLVTGTKYAPVVPKYVAEEHGITSLADLAPNAEKLASRFVGIEAGTPGNQYIADAIAEDAYGLGDWELAESGTSAMLTEVERAAESNEPIVFLGWQPHWMNVEWDLVYLEDPEGVWPGAGEIRVVANEEFHADNPNLMRFFEQMTIDRETASDWIYQLSQEDQDPAEIASGWIEENPDVVAEWMDGVESTDGDPASELL